MLGNGGKQWENIVKVMEKTESFSTNSGLACKLFDIPLYFRWGTNGLYDTVAWINGQRSDGLLENVGCLDNFFSSIFYI